MDKLRSNFWGNPVDVLDSYVQCLSSLEISSLIIEHGTGSRDSKSHLPGLIRLVFEIGWVLETLTCNMFF